MCTQIQLAAIVVFFLPCSCLCFGFCFWGLAWVTSRSKPEDQNSQSRQGVLPCGGEPSTTMERAKGIPAPSIYQKLLQWKHIYRHFAFALIRCILRTQLLFVFLSFIYIYLYVIYIFIFIYLYSVFYNQNCF